MPDVSVSNDEFNRIKMRVQQGHLGFEKAMDHLFNRINGTALPDDFTDVDPPPAQGQMIPPTITVNSNLDGDKKTKDLADASAANMPTGITNTQQGNDLAIAIAYDPEFADHLRAGSGAIDGSSDLTGTITAFSAENPTKVTIDSEDQLLLQIGQTITLEALTGTVEAMGYINGQIVEVLTTSRGNVTLALDMSEADVTDLTADYVRNVEETASVESEDGGVTADMEVAPSSRKRR